jgi:hypothetical protein
MATQLRETLPRFVERFLFLGDGYYGSEVFRTATADLACDVLVRFAKNRVLYGDPSPPTGPRGRGHPRWHGAAFKLQHPATYGPPEAQWEGRDQAGQRVEVRCWQNLHFKKARAQKVSLLQVMRHGALDTKRDPKLSWFLFWGLCLPALEEIPLLYGRRYHLEHGYRSAKQDLLWPTPRLRTPEQFERWTDVVSVVRNSLFLARDLVDARRRPWESARRARTPEQVRRAMGPIIAGLGTPAQVCRTRGYSPGWVPGRSRHPAPTYAVVYKSEDGPPKPAKRRSRRRFKTRLAA